MHSEHPSDSIAHRKADRTNGVKPGMTLGSGIVCDLRNACLCGKAYSEATFLMAVTSLAKAK